MTEIWHPHHVSVVVRAIRRETDRVLSYELADPDDWELPPFAAGAHVDVRSAAGLVRQYSLHGDPADPRRYHLAIQAEPLGRGGSMRLQDELKVGERVALSLPRNHFALASDAAHHILIAGGIGITPILSMVHALNRAGASFELHYSARSPKQMAFRATLDVACADRGHFYFNEAAEPTLLDVEDLLARPRQGTHVYACGPAGMVQAVLDATHEWPDGHVHVELFGLAAGATGAKSAYSVSLRRSARMLEVREDETMLEALRGAGIDVPSSCEAGICLLCKVRYVEGTPLHRDLGLTDAQQREFLTPCVSGCAGASITLDL